MTTPLPAVPKVVRLTFVQSYGDDQNVINTLHYEYAGTESAADLQTLATTAATAWHSDIHPRQVVGIRLDHVLATDLSSSSSPQAVAAAGTLGTNGGNGITGASSMVVKLLIARRYRGGKPKIFLAGFPTSDQQTVQTWSSAALTAADTAMTGLDVAIEGYGGATMGAVDAVSVSYFQGFHVVTNPVTLRAKNVPTLRGGGPVIDPVTGVSADLHIGSQRRRNL